MITNLGAVVAPVTKKLAGVCVMKRHQRAEALRLVSLAWGDIKGQRAFGEPEKSVRLIAIYFSVQILLPGGADGYNNINPSASSLNNKRRLAAFYFTNCIIQREFPLRTFVASNVANPFMGVHSFGSIDALYLRDVRHSGLQVTTTASAIIKACDRLINGLT